MPHIYHIFYTHTDRLSCVKRYRRGINNIQIDKLTAPALSLCSHFSA